MDVQKDCICGKMRRASRLLTNIYDEFLVPTGLKVTQFGLLRRIQRLDQASAAKLSALMQIDKTTLARNLKVLERRNLIEHSEGEDRRVKVINLTAEGASALEAAELKWKEAQEAVAARLGQKRLDRLFEDLAALQ